MPSPPSEAPAPEVPPAGLRARFRAFLNYVASLEETPHQLALGAAIGIFVGFLPIMGIQMYVSVPLAWLAGGNKFLAAAGVWITNPMTFIPFYYVCYRFGLLLYDPKVSLTFGHFSDSIAAADLASLGVLGEAVLVPLTVGCVALGAPAAALTYLATYAYLVRRRAREQTAEPAA